MIFLLTAMFLLSATSTSAARPCVCGKILAPVCGSDQRTYKNKCLLKCAQTDNPALTMVKSGACHDDEPRPKYCICPLVYDPVCFDGNIYPNQCTVTCRHKYTPIKKALDGECRKKRESVQVSEHPSVDCICPYKYAPVCGSDGQTYENNCLFECARAKNGNLRVDDHNNCKKGLPLSCVCPKIYKPLCGSDGETYGNPCLFKCAKKTNHALIMIHKGRC